MNWTEFWHMGGYALFVWGSYGVTALVLLAEMVLLASKKRSLFTRLRRIRKIELG